VQVHDHNDTRLHRDTKQRDIPDPHGLGGTSENRSQSTKKTFVITNNHPDGKAAVSALELQHLLSGETVKAPETLVKHYPQLREFAQGVPGESVERSGGLFQPS
jgi:uncharacterized protein YecE (DUF72 family)